LRGFVHLGRSDIKGDTEPLQQLAPVA
jgi:hypothetical protein